MVICGLMTVKAYSQQVGIGAIPLSNYRIGVEAGGTLNNAGSTSALARYMQNLGSGNVFELGVGGTSGDRGARTFGAFRKELVAEDVSFPALFLRTAVDSYRDNNNVRRNAFGSGFLLSQGFVLGHQEVYGYLHPRAQIAIESASNEFVMVTGTSLGLNTNFTGAGRKWVASVELDLGFQNLSNSLSVGIAADI